MLAEPKTRSVEKRGDPAPGNTGGQKSGLVEKLFLIEAAIREAASLNALQYLIANEFRKVIPAGQIVVQSLPFRNDKPRVEKVSALATIDRNAPSLIWLNSELAAHLSAPVSAFQNSKVDDERDAKSFMVNVRAAPGNRFPFEYGLLVKLFDRSGKLLGAVSFLRDYPFTEQEKVAARRLVETAAHSWAAFSPRKNLINVFLNRKFALIGLALAGLVGIIPVPLTVMAPAKIVARNPIVVAAPLDGVIKELAVEPDSYVQTGDLLFTYEATELEGRYELANRALAVADAKYQRAAQSSFGSGDGKRELAIFRSELEVAAIERDHAAAKLNSARVTAPSNGLVLHLGKEEWAGRPVGTGERVIRIANPTEVAVEIDLAVGDAIPLEAGGEVRLFLDSDPLNPVDAKIERTSYRTRMSERGMLVFALCAIPVNAEKSQLRIGLHGTAQLFSERVPLAYTFIRKPLAKARQFLGL